MIDRYDWDNECDSDDHCSTDRATHPACLLSSQQMVGNDTSTLHLQIRSIRHIYIYYSIHNYILFHDQTLKASQAILLSVWSIPIKKEWKRKKKYWWPTLKLPFIWGGSKNSHWQILQGYIKINYNKQWSYYKKKAASRYHCLHAVSRSLCSFWEALLAKLFQLFWLDGAIVQYILSQIVFVMLCGGPILLSRTDRLISH